MTRRRLLLAAGGLTLLAPALSARAACLSDEEVARLAEALVAGRPVPAPAGLSMADAECTRDKLVPLLARHWGRPIGYKAGATGAAVQRLFGLSGPVYGVMFESTISLRDGAELTLAPPVPNVGVEADLLVRVRDDGINEAGRDHVAILRHLDQVIPYIEMPRTGVSGALDGPGLVAINVAARLGVVGAPIPVRADADFAGRLGTMVVVFADDTRELARAQGSALLGHPLNVIPWLVGDLARGGQRLRAGDIVSLGGFAPSVPAQSGRTYTLRYEGLLDRPVSVSVRIAPAP
jgi:2-keto-4-pentenoate hydratase